MPLPATLHVTTGMRLVRDADGIAFSVVCNCGGNAAATNQRNVSNNRHLYSTPESYAAAQAAKALELQSEDDQS